MERIDAIRSLGDVLDVVATLHRRDMLLDGSVGFVGSRTLFSGRVEPDERNSSRRIFTLSQGGIAVGPGVFTATDAQRVRVRSAFHTYLSSTFLRLHRDSTMARGVQTQCSISNHVWLERSLDARSLAWYGSRSAAVSRPPLTGADTFRSLARRGSTQSISDNRNSFTHWIHSCAPSRWGHGATTCGSASCDHTHHSSVVSPK